MYSIIGVMRGNKLYEYNFVYGDIIIITIIFVFLYKL